MLLQHLLLSLVIFSVDTLYTVDFSDTPGDWIAGPQWQWLGDSVFLDIWCGGDASRGIYYSNEDSLISPLFVIPENADSLVVVFEHYWWAHGFCNTVTEWAQSTSSLAMYSSATPGVPLELWEIIGFVEIDDPALASGSYYNEADSGYVAVSLPNMSPGETITFSFTGLVESYIYYLSAYAYIEWDLFSFTILNYPSASLQRSTWAAIKATY